MEDRRTRHRPLHHADDLLLLRKRRRTPAQGGTRRSNRDQQVQTGRLQDVPERVVRRNEGQRRQVPHERCSPLQRGALRRHIRPPANRGSYRLARTTERPKLVGHRTIHIRHAVRTNHRQAQTQATRHALHLPRGHRTHRRTGSHATAAESMGTREEQSQCTYRLASTAGKRTEFLSGESPRDTLSIHRSTCILASSRPRVWFGQLPVREPSAAQSAREGSNRLWGAAWHLGANTQSPPAPAVRHRDQRICSGSGVHSRVDRLPPVEIPQPARPK